MSEAGSTYVALTVGSASIVSIHLVRRGNLKRTQKYWLICKKNSSVEPIWNLSLIRVQKTKGFYARFTVHGYTLCVTKKITRKLKRSTKLYLSASKSSCVKARGIPIAACCSVSWMLGTYPGQLDKGVPTLAREGGGGYLPSSQCGYLPLLGGYLPGRYSPPPLCRLEGRYNPVSWKVGTTSPSAGN